MWARSVFTNLGGVSKRYQWPFVTSQEADIHQHTLADFFLISVKFSYGIEPRIVENESTNEEAACLSWTGRVGRPGGVVKC